MLATRPAPRLTQAEASLTCEISAHDETGRPRLIALPAERPLTVYVDRVELITLMTLGAHPEWLALGYLLNQGLVGEACEVESITVDWEVQAAAVRLHRPLEHLAALTARRTVTSGCGQGSLFGHALDAVAPVRLDPVVRLRQSALTGIVAAIREQPSIYRQAGSVHGCALFAAGQLRLFIEDVGRHNAIDAIAGWLALQAQGLHDTDTAVFYTTGRLTSEMVLKAARMNVGFVVSRSGITQMGQSLADRLGVCAIGRAINRRFLCYSHPERLLYDEPVNA